MALTITRPDGTVISVDNVAEAAALLDILAEKQFTVGAPAKVPPMHVQPSRGSGNPDPMLSNPWTPQRFLAFLESLGPVQRDLLGYLVRNERASDEELREAAGVETNQALAGILSGISKRTLAVGVSPRDVFSLYKQRRPGGRSSTYAITESFLFMANEARVKTDIDTGLF